MRIGIAFREKCASIRPVHDISFITRLLQRQRLFSGGAARAAEQRPGRGRDHQADAQQRQRR